MKKKRKKSFVIIREIGRRKKKKNSREKKKYNRRRRIHANIFLFFFFFFFSFPLSFTFVRVQDEIAIYRGVGRGRRSSKQFCQALKYKRVGLLLSRMMALNIHFAPGPLYNFETPALPSEFLSLTARAHPPATFLLSLFSPATFSTNPLFWRRSSHVQARVTRSLLQR